MFWLVVSGFVGVFRQWLFSSERSCLNEWLNGGSSRWGEGVTRLTSAQRLSNVGASGSQRRMHGAKARRLEGEQESCLGVQGERHLD